MFSSDPSNAWRARIVSRGLIETRDNEMIKPRILLAEDHPKVREVLLNLLVELGEVVGAVADGQALVEAAQWLKPDIIISDISLPKLNGLNATRALRICAPQSKVIILTAYQEPEYLTLAFDAGARGFLLKRTALHAELPQALLHVLAGDRYIGLGVKEERVPVDGDRIPMWISEV
jgi:DNA-binding NarL/FixJ family response regulator